MTRLQQMLLDREDDFRNNAGDISQLKQHPKLSAFTDDFIKECWEEYSDTRSAGWLCLSQDSADVLWNWLNEDTL